MKENLLEKEDFKKAVPALNNKIGDLLTRGIMSISGLNKLNRLYNNSKQYTGVDFCRSALNDIGVNVVVENKKVLNRFKANEAFITISNHPYGHIDGISIIAEVGSVRSDYKVMANFILGIIDTLENSFIKVNPYKDKAQKKAAALDSVKQCLKHIEDGHPFGFFPAGAVSDLKFKRGRFKIEDEDWKLSTVRVIKKANVPVIPVYFSGGNSMFYYLLDAISWKLSSVRLLREINNKKGKTVHMRFGEPVEPSELQKYSKAADVAAYLRSKVYALAQKRNFIV